MRKVSRPVALTQDAVAAKVVELCTASQEQTEEIADSYTLTLPAGFLPTRTLNVAAPTTANIAAVLATLLQDLQRRGVNRKQANV